MLDQRLEDCFVTGFKAPKLGPLDYVNHKFRWLSDEEVLEAASIVDPMKEEYESCTARQVNFCYELIVANRFVPGKTIKELAVIWGVSVDAVKRHSSEAYRRLKADIRDPEEIRGAIIQRLDTVMSMAMNHKKPYLTKEGEVIYADEPNYNAAVAAAKEIKALVGLDIRKIEHSHKEYETADLPELLEHWRKHKEAKRLENERPRTGQLGPAGAVGIGAGNLRGKNRGTKVPIDIQADGSGDPPVSDPET
jgi:hypothetical protein